MGNATAMDGQIETDWIDPRTVLGGFLDDLYYPHYRSGQVGDWAMKLLLMPAGRGYWGEVYPLTGTVIMEGPARGKRHSWMSMLPVELQSQEIGLRAAYGHTVVCGMGMGWLAANVAMRPAVERVTVVERDPDVIGLMEYQGVFARLPDEARRKVTIVEADALVWRPDAPVDSLQADIWLKLLEDDKLDETRRMQANMRADQVYFWGQEMEIWRYACRRAEAVPDLDWPAIRTIVEEDLRLPLVLPDWEDYPQRIAAAATWWTPREENWWSVATTG